MTHVGFVGESCSQVLQFLSEKRRIGVNLFTNTTKESRRSVSQTGEFNLDAALRIHLYSRFD
jgi:hypothetical protein